MQIDKIFQRINFIKGEKFTPSIENLNLLINAFILKVPYENLNFKFKVKFSVNILDIYKKIVELRRGGVCYETNTLFAYLIKSLGYKVNMIFANVNDETNIASNYPHLALMVTIKKEDYLVDVGMGLGPRSAIKIDDEFYEVEAEGYKYSIRSAGSTYALLQKDDKETITKYTFTKDVKRVSDFSYVFDEIQYEKYSNEAPLLVTLAKKDGRVTVIDDKLIIKKDDDKRVLDIKTMNKAKLLNDYFDIKF